MNNAYAVIHDFEIDVSTVLIPGMGYHSHVSGVCPNHCSLSHHLSLSNLCHFSSYARFIMYAQIIGTLFDTDFQRSRLLTWTMLKRNGDISAFMKVIMALYGVFHFDLVHLILPPFCISSRLKFIHVVFFGCFSLFHPILLIFLISICVELHGRNLVTGLYFVLILLLYLVKGLVRTHMYFQPFFVLGIFFSITTLIIPLAKPYKKAYMTYLDTLKTVHCSLLSSRRMSQ